MCCLAFLSRILSITKIYHRLLRFNDRESSLLAAVHSGKNDERIKSGWDWKHSPARRVKIPHYLSLIVDLHRRLSSREKQYLVGKVIFVNRLVASNRPCVSSIRFPSADRDACDAIAEINLARPPETRKGDATLLSLDSPSKARCREGGMGV